MKLLSNSSRKSTFSCSNTTSKIVVIAWNDFLTHWTRRQEVVHIFGCEVSASKHGGDWMNGQASEIIWEGELSFSRAFFMNYRGFHEPLSTDVPLVCMRRISSLFIVELMLLGSVKRVDGVFFTFLQDLYIGQNF